MSQIEVPDWVVEVAAKALYETSPGCNWANLKEIYRDVHRAEAKAALTAALGAWVVPQHQAQWIVEQCWEDITPKQFADLEETEAVTRTLYDLRQEKPE